MKPQPPVTIIGLRVGAMTSNLENPIISRDSEWYIEQL